MQRSLWVTALAGIVLTGGAPAFADMKIGTAGPLSNAEALFGNDLAERHAARHRRGQRQAGGVDGQQIVLVRQDDQGDPKQGTLIAQKFCDDDSIAAVIANFNSGVTIPSSDVYNRCGLPQVTNSSNPKVTAAGYQNLFRPIANDFMQGGAPATTRCRRWAPRAPRSSTTSRLSARASRPCSAILREGRRQDHLLFRRHGDRRRLLRGDHPAQDRESRTSSTTAARCRASDCS